MLEVFLCFIPRLVDWAREGKGRVPVLLWSDQVESSVLIDRSRNLVLDIQAVWSTLGGLMFLMSS